MKMFTTMASTGADSTQANRMRTTQVGQLIQFLNTRSGRYNSALSAEVGWQPHTTRAARAHRKGRVFHRKAAARETRRGTLSDLKRPADYRCAPLVQFCNRAGSWPTDHDALVAPLLRRGNEIPSGLVTDGLQIVGNPDSSGQLIGLPWGGGAQADLANVADDLAMKYVYGLIPCLQLVKLRPAA